MQTPIYNIQNPLKNMISYCKEICELIKLRKSVKYYVFKKKLLLKNEGGKITEHSEV